MHELEQALANQINQSSDDNLLLKAIYYLICYQIQHQAEMEEEYGKETQEKEKVEYPLKDSYEGLWKKRPIPKLIPYVS